MAEGVSMSREGLSESQEKLLGDLITQLKEIREICLPWSNIPRDNQSMLDACDIFLGKLRNSGDISLIGNKSLQATLNTIIPPLGFPEVYKYIVMGIFDVAAESAQNSELDKNVQGAIADVAAAAQAGVEMRVEFSYGKSLEDFGNRYYRNGIDGKDWIGDTEILEEDGCLVIYFQDSPIVYFPITLREELQNRSWSSIMSFDGMEHSLITSTDFSFVLRWLDNIGITSKTAQADFFKNVFGLEDGIYLCKDSQSGDVECNAFNLSDRGVEHCAVGKGMQSLNYRALTR